MISTVTTATVLARWSLGHASPCRTAGFFYLLYVSRYDQIGTYTLRRASVLDTGPRGLIICLKSLCLASLATLEQFRGLAPSIPGKISHGRQM